MDSNCGFCLQKLKTFLHSENENYKKYNLQKKKKNRAKRQEFNELKPVQTTIQNKKL